MSRGGCLLPSERGLTAGWESAEYRSKTRAKGCRLGYGLSPRRAAARSVRLPRLVSVLDRGGPRQRHLRLGTGRRGALPNAPQMRRRNLAATLAGTGGAPPAMRVAPPTMARGGGPRAV